MLRHSGELPGQYFLAYYTDKNRRKMKGRIDLDQCEQVRFITYYLNVHKILKSDYNFCNLFCKLIIIVIFINNLNNLFD